MRNKKDELKLYRPYDMNKVYSSKPTIDKEMWRDMVYFIKERYKIRLKKEAGESQPWTKDKILQTWRFTNVRREHDRVTKWAIKHICLAKGLTLEEKIANLTIFRAYNTITAAEALDLPIKLYTFKRKDLLPLIEVANSKAVFTGVFMVSGMIREMKGYSGCKRSAIVPVMAARKWLTTHTPRITYADQLTCKHPQEFIDTIRQIKGVGDFLAYQIFVDCTYIPDFPFSENNFVIAGPGCKKGLDFLFKNRGGMTYEECLFWLVWKLNHKVDFSKIFTDLPKYDQRMNVMSIENIMCEFSKYERIKGGTARGKKRYKPHKEDEDE